MISNKPFFSMVIACHNSSKYIERLLTSLANQNLAREDLQVILVDDNSTDNWQEIARKYISKLNIEFYSTNTSIHCPGNTRNEGMKHVKGEWLCFCDHDDLYENEALYKVKTYLEKSKEKDVLCTMLRSWDEKTNKFTELYRKQAWLHGKFYNVRFLEENNIIFKPDLITHEDIYFNSCVLNALVLKGRPMWSFYDIPTYRWIDEPTSITRGYTVQNKSIRGYLMDNFNDYIISATEPYWDSAMSGNVWCIHQILMCLLHCYFYYEESSYFHGPSNYKDVLEHIKSLLKNIRDNFNISNEMIINYIYQDPKLYDDVKADCEIHEGRFIVKTSFRDFIFKIGHEENRCAVSSSNL